MTKKEMRRDRKKKEHRLYELRYYHQLLVESVHVFDNDIEANRGLQARTEAVQREIRDLIDLLS